MRQEIRHVFYRINHVIFANFHRAIDKDAEQTFSVTKFKKNFMQFDISRQKEDMKNFYDAIFPGESLQQQYL